MTNSDQAYESQELEITLLGMKLPICFAAIKGKGLYPALSMFKKVLAERIKVAAACAIKSFTSLGRITAVKKTSEGSHWRREGRARIQFACPGAAILQAPLSYKRTRSDLSGSGQSGSRPAAESLVSPTNSSKTLSGATAPQCEDFAQGAGTSLWQARLPP